MGTEEPTGAGERIGGKGLTESRDPPGTAGDGQTWSLEVWGVVMVSSNQKWSSAGSRPHPPPSALVCLRAARANQGAWPDVSPHSESPSLGIVQRPTHPRVSTTCKRPLGSPPPQDRSLRHALGTSPHPTSVGWSTGLLPPGATGEPLKSGLVRHTHLPTWHYDVLARLPLLQSGPQLVRATQAKLRTIRAVRICTHHKPQAR